MRVLVFSHEYPSFGGGAGIVAQQLVKDLSNLGVTVDVLTKQRADNDLTYINKSYEVSYRGLPWFIAYSLYIKRKVKLSNYDFIICNDNVSQYIAGLIFKKNQLKKSILLLHGSEPEYFYLNDTIKAKFLLLKYIYNRAINSPAKIVAHSLYMKEKFLEHSSAKLDNKFIDVFYFGFDANKFKISNKSSLRNKLGLDSTDHVLLSVSRIVKKKGFLRKLEIFSQAKQADSSLKWVIIGDGPFLAELKSQVKLMSLQDEVLFVGKVVRSQLKYYYTLADVFWLLSEFKESFGLVYIESQACGTPAIGNDLYGVKEAILNKKTGILANSDDEILDYLAGRAYTAHDKKELVDFSSNFHSAMFAKYLIEQYKT